jgi:hypothetical protein
MDSTKLKERKYPTAIKLAQGEKDKLPEMYDSGVPVKDIAFLYNTTVSTVVKALVFLGYDGPDWAKDAVKRTLEKNNITPSNMKRVSEPLI